MRLVERQRIARDTVAFWFDTHGATFEFRAGQHADFAFSHPFTSSEMHNSRTVSLAGSPLDKRPANPTSQKLLRPHDYFLWLNRVASDQLRNLLRLLIGNIVSKIGQHLDPDVFPTVGSQHIFQAGHYLSKAAVPSGQN